MSLPKVHPREIPVREAYSELLGFCIDIQKKYDLTDTELLCVFNKLETSTLMYLLRDERHFNELDKSANIE